MAIFPKRLPDPVDPGSPENTRVLACSDVLMKALKRVLAAQHRGWAAKPTNTTYRSIATGLFF